MSATPTHIARRPSNAFHLDGPARATEKVWRIGTLHTSSSSDAVDRVAALQRGLAEFGDAGGRNVLFVNQNAGTQMGRLPESAAQHPPQRTRGSRCSRSRPLSVAFARCLDAFLTC